MTSSTYLSRSTDYLGNLGATLRDLQGYATLAHELIQNADDAPARSMTFNIHEDSLVLDNDGVFSECGDVEADQCEFITGPDGTHRCDFHRFRLIGSGDKRLEGGTTGAFGIGFISVYQLTDQPQLISANRHWTLHDDRAEGERIEACRGCDNCRGPDLPGTRFILPFARDEQSVLRQALKAEPVPQNVTERLLGELKRCLPVAMIFLKNLRKIEIRRDGHQPLTFERVIEGNTLLISQGDNVEDQVWHLLRGGFEERAIELRSQNPGRIEEKRSAEVAVALPNAEWTAGLLCACLPTEESPGLPFHVNADFFPTNDRKRIILGDDYQSHWNRAALSAAARIVAGAVPDLAKTLGAERFWHLADTLRELSANSRNDGPNRPWGDFWNALQEPLKTAAVIPTSTGDWTALRDGVSLLQNEDEAVNISVLEGLGLRLVSEGLRPYQTTFRSIGVSPLNMDALCAALTNAGLDKATCFNDLPSCLARRSERESLWTEIGILMARLVSRPQARHDAEDKLLSVAIAPTVSGALAPCRQVVRADTETIELFDPLGLNILFLDQTERAFEPLASLCTSFGSRAAVDALESNAHRSMEQMRATRHFPIMNLVQWFEGRRDEILRATDVRSRVAALPIYPSTDGRLESLTTLILPGDFEDPFKLAGLVDLRTLGGRREFLRDLGARVLDFPTFVRDYLPIALADGNSTSNYRGLAISLLAGRIRELRDDPKIRETLSKLPIVLCIDGECRPPDDCYFHEPTVEQVLGREANIAVLPSKDETAVRELFRWLGTQSAPRPRDIVKTVRRISAGPCGERSVQWIQNIVVHLGRRFQETPIPPELRQLREIEWLPARRDRSRWFQPSSLYAPYQSYLFESQASVLDVPNPDRRMLEHFGVRINPYPGLVVRHLLHCASRGEPVNPEVYRFLNDNTSDPAVAALQPKKCLWIGDAYRSASEVFWSEHPFGQYRWRLADNLRGYGHLLETIGVSDTPDYRDAVKVLREISAEFSGADNRLGDETYRVVMGCWKMLEDALANDFNVEKSLASLGTAKCIPDKSHSIKPPSWLFFENRAGLADRFGSFLTSNLIERPLRTGQAYMAAGVRQLGSVVEVDLVRNDDPAEDLEMRVLLQNRGNEIARVLSSQIASQYVQVALDRLENLVCMSAAGLAVRYRLNAFNRVMTSEPEPAQATYQPPSHRLWIARRQGNVPWATLARELAIALCPTEDPGPFAAGLKEVLSTGTTVEAATVLDELGFPQLDTTIVPPPAIVGEADQLGIGDPEIGDASRLDYEGSNQSLDANDERALGDLTVDDALGKLGIDPPPSPSIPFISELGHSNSSGGGAVGGSSSVGDKFKDRTESNGSGVSRQGYDNSRNRVKSGGPSGSRRDFVSYIAVNHQNDSEPDPDGLTQQERYDLEASAIQLILGEEPELSETPLNNPGYDLVELEPDGRPIKWVEVKAMKGTLDDRPVGISKTQFEWAQKHREIFWLYVVENAGAPENSRVVRIQDPVGKAQTFTFDRGWVSVAESLETSRS